ncbi:atrial natriuretic peptide-converting enzyme-like [Lethenteron reissneri]|uniref:atrial natriuretic peptide-converting enzyme-like n=1 Tax=Lethenteron reissneri TaxID=7753 RepID=UPI002AB66A8B|nr:atrial natriuretic peptide-converting enzyme-like [Lethenteron reissneri]
MARNYLRLLTLLAVLLSAQGQTTPTALTTHLPVTVQITPLIIECAGSDFQCAVDKRCILGILYCDGVADCADQSDETPNCQCRSDQIRCGDGTCLGIEYVCDGVYDCGDYSDENNCICTPSQYKCNNSNTECLDWIYICDGETDCSDGSDESSCEKECSDSEFRCADKKHCIPGHFYCDGEPDCADQTEKEMALSAPSANGAQERRSERKREQRKSGTPAHATRRGTTEESGMRAVQITKK